jgi:hypothetical protein
VKRSVPIDAHSIGTARAARPGKLVPSSLFAKRSCSICWSEARFVHRSSPQLAAGAGARRARAVFWITSGAYRRPQSSKSKACQ